MIVKCRGKIGQIGKWILSPHLIYVLFMFIFMYIFMMFMYICILLWICLCRFVGVTQNLYEAVSLSGEIESLREKLFRCV